MVLRRNEFRDEIAFKYAPEFVISKLQDREKEGTLLENEIKTSRTWLKGYLESFEKSPNEVDFKLAEFDSMIRTSFVKAFISKKG